MGWNITIKTTGPDGPPNEAAIDYCIERLPKSFAHGASRQRWGWSLAVDIRLSGDSVELSGSYGMSGKIAEGFAEAFARQLEHAGFRAEVGPMT